LVIFTTILNVIGILLTIAFVVYVIIKREEKVIQAARPTFLFLISLASLIGFVANFVSIIQPYTAITCTVVPFMNHICLLLGLSLIFAKSWRIIRLFTIKSVKIDPIGYRKDMFLGDNGELSLFNLYLVEGFHNFKENEVYVANSSSHHIQFQKETVLSHATYEIGETVNVHNIDLPGSSFEPDINPKLSRAEKRQLFKLL